MNNVMLDLETMGKGPHAAIVTIGAVFFDPMTGELGAEFEAHIDLRDSARFGEIDPDTVLWWLGQSDEARAAIAYNVDGDKRMALLQALQKFQEWLMQEGKRPCVWGNGAGFDCTIMASAYDAVNKVRFIGYWNGFKDRDVRTVVDMGRDLLGFDPKKDMPFEGVAHRALDDAKHQARYVSAIYQRMQAAMNGCGMVGGCSVRDPRKYPVPGDVITRFGTTREVTATKQNNRGTVTHVVYRHPAVDLPETVATIASWRAWAKSRMPWW